MDRKAYINYLYTAVYQILIVVLPLITTPYISRVLGVENVGKCAYASTIVTYFILFAQIGLNIYGRREIALHQGAPEKRSLIFWQLFSIRCELFLAVGVFFCLYMFLLSHDEPILLWIYGVTLLSNMIDITWFFQGMEKFRLITLRNLFIRITSVVFVFCMIKSEKDIYLYAAIVACSDLISQVSLWISLKKVIVKIPFTMNGNMRHLKSSFIMFIPTVFNSLYTKMDKIMLGIMTNDVQVGLYSQAERIIDLLAGLFASMSVVFMPTIAKMIAEDDYTPYEKNEIEQHIKTAVETYFANQIYVGRKLSINRLESYILQYLFDEKYDIYEVEVEIETNSDANIDQETGQIKIEDYQRLYPNIIYTTIEYNYDDK